MPTVIIFRPFLALVWITCNVILPSNQKLEPVRTEANSMHVVIFSRLSSAIFLHAPYICMHEINLPCLLSCCLPAHTNGGWSCHLT